MLTTIVLPPTHVKGAAHILSFHCILIFGSDSNLPLGRHIIFGRELMGLSLADFTPKTGIGTTRQLRICISSDCGIKSRCYKTFFMLNSARPPLKLVLRHMDTDVEVRNFQKFFNDLYKQYARIFGLIDMSKQCRLWSSLIGAYNVCPTTSIFMTVFLHCKTKIDPIQDNYGGYARCPSFYIFMV